MSRGHRESLDGFPVTLVQGNFGDERVLDEIFRTHLIAAVLHFGGYTYVGDSVKEPVVYYQNNLIETFTLLKTMLKHQCKRFVFSSTCSTYGVPQRDVLNEEHPQKPINPYGKTKLMVEEILADFDIAYQFKSMSLRYFNASGASSDGKRGEDHRPETHLIPLLLKAIQGIEPPLTIFGEDYDTPDGTCIRDYIHVEDLADAHLLALKKLLNGGNSHAYNLGTEKGFSVLEILKMAEHITGKKVPYKMGQRRAGDPACLIADSSKARKELNWIPKRSQLDYILSTAWKWLEKKGSYQY